MTWLVSAFLLGLFGSAHCVVMCGGIAGALSCGVVKLGRAPRPVPSALAYNTGRIAAYVALGALVGALGPQPGVVRLGMRLAAGLFLAGAGLYVAGAFRRFAFVERAGAPLWRRVAPLAGRLAQSPTLPATLAVGALWGLLPCGLVYAAFGLALASGTLAHGALVMAAFGLGTAPAMMATGLASARVAPAVRSRAWLRRAAGALVFVFGAIDVASAGASIATPSHAVCACHRAVSR